MIAEEIIKYKANRDGIQARMKLDGKWIVIGCPTVKGADMDTIGRFSGQFDIGKKPIFEGDICSVDIKNDFGSMTKGLAVMVWSDIGSLFLLEIINDRKEVRLDLQCSNVLVIGNLTDNPELICPEKIPLQSTSQN